MTVQRGERVYAGEPLSVALQRIWLNELHRLEQQVPGVIEGRDSEYLHQFRVALRRTRALLKSLEKSLPPHTQLAAELKWLAMTTGPLRDLDIHYSDFRAWLGPLWSGPGLLVLEEFHQRRIRAHTELVEVLRGDRFRELVCSWRRYLGFLPGNPSRRIACATSVTPELPLRVKKLCRRFCKQGRELGAHASDADLHQMRIRGKRLRYLLEAFEPVFARRRRMRNLIAALKNLQTTLGEHQDCVVARSAFRAFAGQVGQDTDTVFQLGRWDRELELRQCCARRAFDERFAVFASACDSQPWRE